MGKSHLPIREGMSMRGMSDNSRKKSLKNRRRDVDTLVVGQEMENVIDQSKKGCRSAGHHPTIFVSVR